VKRLSCGRAGMILAGIGMSLGFGFGDVPQDRAPVVVVPVTGVIELGLAPSIERALREAEEEGATALVLDIDTPGGRVDAAERIGDAIADAGVPVYAYINRRALSAGALISLATDGILMRPGSVIGAATPVDGSGQKASEKIVSAMRSEMRALAEAAGLDPTVAEAMVDERIAIPDVVEEGQLLTLTTEEAVALGYAREVEDLNAVLAVAGAQGAHVRRHEINWSERLVRFLSHPTVAQFLLSLGFLGLIIEIRSPGLGAPGLVGVLCLTGYFGSHVIVGLAGWNDLLLVGGGVGLMAIEALVIPGFGIFGILGIVAIAGGVFMSMIGGLPTSADFAQAGTVVSLALIIILVTSWALFRHLPRNRHIARSGLLLKDATDRAHGFESARRRVDLVGHEGVALTDLRPAGTGLFGDERLDVVADSEFISEGEAIRVMSAEGYRCVVRPVKKEPQASEDAGEA
jgi:membrane-bound serine protease (ClpP class)